MSARNGIRSASVVVALLTILLFPHRAGATAFVIQKVADENTDYPGHLGWMSSFTSFGVPAYDTGKVIFAGEGWGVTGLVMSKSGKLSSLINDTNTIPGVAGATKFTYFADPDIDGDYVSFLGARPGATKTWGSGVYLLDLHPSTNPAPTVSRIADTNTTIPGSTRKFHTFLSPHLEGNRVAFSGLRFNGTPGGIPAYPVFSDLGIYDYPVDGSLGFVVDANTIIPGTGGATFGYLGMLDNDAINVVFVGASPEAPPSTAGVYTISSWSTLKAVADLKTVIPSPPPGENGVFKRFLGGSLSGATVAFQAEGVNSRGIYSVSVAGSNLKKIVDTSTIAPGGGGKFTEFDQMTLDGTELVFEGGTMGPQGTVSGLYYRDFAGGQLSKVVRDTDKLGGKQLWNISYRSQGFDQSTLAFHVLLEGNKEALYTASAIKAYASTFSIPLPLMPSQRYQFDLSLGEEGAGIQEPLYLAPQEPLPMRGLNYETDGPRFATVTLPEVFAMGETAELLLFDDELNHYSDTGIRLQPGIPFNLTDFDPGGVRGFSVRGFQQADSGNSDLFDPLAMGAVGVTFVEGSNSVLGLSVTTLPVPEPSTWILAAMAIGSYACYRRWKRT